MEEKGVTPVAGSIMLLAVVIAVTSLIAIDIAPWAVVSELPPYVELGAGAGSFDNVVMLTITHEGGETLDSGELMVLAENESAMKEVDMRWWPTQFSLGDAGVGIYLYGMDPEGKEIRVKVVHPPSGTILLDTFTTIVSGSGMDEWPTYRRDSEHTGYSTSPSPTENLIWWKRVGSGIFTYSTHPSLAIAEGGVYGVGTKTVENNDYVYCLDAENGDDIWEFNLHGTLVNSSPAVADGKVYIGTRRGHSGPYNQPRLYCLDADTGENIWSFVTEGIIRSSPAVAGGRIYFGSWDKNVYCLDADDGEEIWRFETGSEVYSSPAVVGGRVYVGSGYGAGDTDVNRFYCLDADDGEEIWSISYEHPHGDNMPFLTPVVVGERVYVNSHDSNLYCLDADDGEEIWRFLTGNYLRDFVPAVADGRVYANRIYGMGESGSIYCLDADTGEEIWDFHTDGTTYSSPAVAGGRIYFGSRDNNVYCLDADNGELIWSYQTGDGVISSPAVVDGRLYITSLDGNVYCFGPAIPT